MSVERWAFAVDSRIVCVANGRVLTRTWLVMDVSAHNPTRTHPDHRQRRILALYEELEIWRSVFERFWACP